MFSRISSLILKNKIIKGTFILTFAGFSTRIIGFLFRIFLTGKIGAEGLGIYQLIFPIQIICHAICAIGFETAISKLTAESVSKKNNSGEVYLKICLILSIVLSIILSLVIYNFSDFISSRILLEKRCNTLIKVLAFSIPFSSMHACINGYFLGQKQTKIPAESQLIEQIMRVISIVAFIFYLEQRSIPVTPYVAVIGNVVGEMSSMSFCLFHVHKKLFTKTSVKNFSKKNISNVLYLSIPISMNRLMISTLQSIESVLIPNMLIIYGLSSKKALGIYGILMGLVLPLILFPGAIINSLSLMILPAVSEADSSNNIPKIVYTIKHSLKICCIFGIFCSFIFVQYGTSIGIILFSSAEAGKYISLLGFLCPFIYISVTLSSIINGMGHTSVTFVFNIISTLIQIGTIIFIIPQYGIHGFINGFLISNALNALLLFIYTVHLTPFEINLFSVCIYPILILFVLGKCVNYIFSLIGFTNSCFAVILSIISIACGYILILKKEIKDMLTFSA